MYVELDRNPVPKLPPTALSSYIIGSVKHLSMACFTGDSYAEIVKRVAHESEEIDIAVEIRPRKEIYASILVLRT
jgi:hypothetical protein